MEFEVIRVRERAKKISLCGEVKEKLKDENGKREEEMSVRMKPIRQGWSVSKTMRKSVRQTGVKRRREESEMKDACDWGKGKRRKQCWFK